MKLLSTGLGFLTVISLLAVSALMGFPVSSALAAQSPQLTNVSIVPGASDLTSTAYSPDVVTVVIGINNTVVWTNNDAVTHSATGTNTTINSFDIQPGSNGRFTFTTAGTYPYHCFYHPSMVGKVIVKAGATVTTMSSSTSSTSSQPASAMTTTSTVMTSPTSLITSSIVQSTSTTVAPASSGELPTTTIFAGVGAAIGIAVIGFLLLRRRK